MHVSAGERQQLRDHDDLRVGSSRAIWPACVWTAVTKTNLLTVAYCVLHNYRVEKYHGQGHYFKGISVAVKSEQYLRPHDHEQGHTPGVKIFLAI